MRWLKNSQKETCGVKVSQYRNVCKLQRFLSVSGRTCGSVCAYLTPIWRVFNHLAPGFKYLYSTPKSAKSCTVSICMNPVGKFIYVHTFTATWNCEVYSIKKQHWQQNKVLTFEQERVCKQKSPSLFSLSPWGTLDLDLVFGLLGCWKGPFET